MVLPRYLKCTTLASVLLSMVMVGEEGGSIVQVGVVPPSFRDWLSGWRAWMPQRSGPASAAGLVLRGTLMRSHRQRKLLGGVFAGASSLLWVDTGRGESHPSSKDCRSPSPHLGQHGTATGEKGIEDNGTSTQPCFTLLRITYIYTHTHTHKYIHIFIYIHTHINIYIYIYTYTRTHTHAWIHTHTHMHTHTHTHIYIYIHATI